jgi:hypothetical protein
MATTRTPADAFSTRFRALQPEHISRWQTVAEARLAVQELRLKQHELRSLKGEIKHEMHAIRSEFTSQRAHVKINPVDRWFMDGVRGVIKRRETIRIQEFQALTPYQQVEGKVDRAILYLSERKLALDRWIAEHKLAR